MPNIAILLILVGSILTLGGTIHGTITDAQHICGEDLIKQCEVQLPRNQNCILKAIPEESDK